MSSSVTVSIATNTAIAASKGFGWLLTGSPTLFAETVHSLADVGNQVLLKVGEVRGRGTPTREYPFGRAQEKYFWALVSAVSVFFIGCGINIYHGIDVLLHPGEVQPFTPLVLGLLLFALALESWTLTIALREIGGIRAIRANLAKTTILAVLLEDSVALIGILLTLLVAGVSLVRGPDSAFDAIVSIVVGVMLGAMALLLAAINRKLLIDTSDREVDAAARRWFEGRAIRAEVRSLQLDSDHAVLFVTAAESPADCQALGAALERHLETEHGKRIENVYWRFGQSAARR